jgi:hypothetical protein
MEMAKIKGFSILAKATWSQLWEYKHYWEECGVEVKFTAFKEAHQWIADTHLLKDIEGKPSFELTDLEKELQNRGYIAHWQFDEENLETVLIKWLEYKKTWQERGLPENADGVE